jgi:hypothetical protein
MSEKKNPSYERYRRGMALQLAGVPAKDIALKLGLKNAQAWHSTRAYHKGKELAERALDMPEDRPEPAGILADIDCERKAPRDRAVPSILSVPAENHQDWSLDVPVTKPRINIKQTFSAQGEAVRYRVADGLVWIGRGGQKRASLTLSPDECRVMIRELEEFLEQVESA